MGSHPYGNNRRRRHIFLPSGTNLRRSLCYLGSHLVIYSVIIIVQSQRKRIRGIHILKSQICAQRFLPYGLTPHGPRIKTLPAVPGILQSRFGIHWFSDAQQAWDPLHILIVPGCSSVVPASITLGMCREKSQLAEPYGDHTLRYKHHGKLDKLKRNLVIRKR